MKKILLLIALSLGLSASAQSVFEGVYSPLPADPNGPDAEYQLISRHYGYNDTASFFHFRKELTILRNRALTAYAWLGESFVVWNPEVEELIINECYTIQRDGKRVEMNPAGYVEQLPSACADCGFLNHMRELAIVHCGMDYGCTIVLDYTIVNHRNSRSEWALPDLVLNQDCPVKKYEVVYDSPNEMNYSYSGNPQVVNDGHSLHLVWNNLPQTYQEPYLPTAKQLYSTLRITSTLPTDEGRFAIENIDINPEMELLVTSIDDRDLLKYATHIRDYVVDNIRTVNQPEYEEYSDEALVWNAWRYRCGTPEHKTCLLGQLFKAAGFEPQVDLNSRLVHLTIDSIDYAFSPVSKHAVKPFGAAIDAIDSVLVNQTIEEPKLESLAGRYSRLSLPAESRGLNIYPAYLTPSRKAPLAVRPILEDYSYTITLPEGIRMVGKPVSISKKQKGLGEMQISISQEGNTLKVHRRLSVNTDIIAIGKDYKAFREWMILWDQHKTITLQ